MNVISGESFSVRTVSTTQGTPMKPCILGSPPSKPTYTASNPPQPTVKHHIQRKTKFTPWSNGATPSGCSTNLTRRRATHNKTSPRARCYVRGRTTIPWWLILLNRPIYLMSQTYFHSAKIKHPSSVHPPRKQPLRFHMAP